MVTWFGRHDDAFGMTENAFFSCIYNSLITVSPTSSFSASFNGNRVKHHPIPWTWPLSIRWALHKSSSLVVLLLCDCVSPGQCADWAEAGGTAVSEEAWSGDPGQGGRPHPRCPPQLCPGCLNVTDHCRQLCGPLLRDLSFKMDHCWWLHGPLLRDLSVPVWKSVVAIWFCSQLHSSDDCAALGRGVRKRK